MAQIVVFVFLVTLTLTFDLCSIFFITRIAHDVLEGYMSLFRNPIGPKSHWFEIPFVRNPIGPKMK